MKQLLCVTGFIVGIILATATKPDLLSPAILVNIAGVVLASASLYRLTKCEMPKTKKE